jgi:O-antigen/teichoic acid export membrane protein
VAGRGSGAKRAFAHSGATAIISMGLAVLTGILAARLLGAEGRGYLGLITFWSTFFAVFGRPPVADVMVVEAGGGEGHGVSKAFLRRILTLARVCLLLFAPIYLGAIWLYFSQYPADIRLTALGFAAVVLFCSFQSQVYEGVFRANQAFNLLFLFRLSVPALYLVNLLATLLYFEPDVQTFAAAHAVAMLMSLGFRVLISTRAEVAPEHEQAQGGDPVNKPLGELRAMLMSFYGGTVFTFLTLHVDRAMIMLTQSVEDIGIYLVAIALALPAQGLIGYALNSVGLPALVKVAKHKRAGAYQRLLRLTFVTSLLQSLAIALVAPFVIPILFGSEFESAGPMTSAIALATVFMPVRRAFAEIFRAERQANAISVGEASYLAGFALLFLAGHVAGLAWPFVPAFFLANLGAVAFLWRRLLSTYPEARLGNWLLPRWRSITELIEVGRSAIARRESA